MDQNNMIKDSISGYDNIPSLRKYVRVRDNKDVAALEKAGWEWAKVREANRLDYELDWFGIPIIQSPEDLALMQELIFKLKPDVIVEVGIAHGGSLIYYSSLLELLNPKGKIIGVDIEIRSHNRQALEQHPMFKRVELIVGSSIENSTFEEIKKKIPPDAKVLVCLDSDHTHQHVLKELNIYQELVKVGGYIVVFDSNSSQLAAMGADGCERYLNNGPSESIRDFLKENHNFEIDKSYNKFFISTSPDGYLKRIR